MAGPLPAAWANSIVLGQQTGGFAQTVTGLSPNTLYYFAAQATNSAGPAWAAPSQSFTTQATNTPSSFVAVLTQHNDSGRTGMNLNESFLNVTNVNTNQFGLVFSRNVDDQIYAQPLVMTNVSILGRGTHNLVIVATVNDSVYAFDADNPSVVAPYWTTSFINPPNIVAPANSDFSAIGACGGGYQDFSGNTGIVGTPVIDPVAGTIYLVARTKEYGTNFVQRLHALDVSTGAERSNSPVIITATYAGTGTAMLAASSLLTRFGKTSGRGWRSSTARFISAGPRTATTARITAGSLVMTRPPCNASRFTTTLPMAIRAASG